jgi:hypothetical protein
MATERTRQRMMALVRQWEASSDSRQVFARRHGLTVACFDYWKRRVRRVPPAEPRVRFAPVHVVADDHLPPVTTTIEVVLVSGERLTIPAGTSSDHLRAVLAALRASC